MKRKTECLDRRQWNVLLGARQSEVEIRTLAIFSPLLLESLRRPHGLHPLLELWVVLVSCIEDSALLVDFNDRPQSVAVQVVLVGLAGDREEVVIVESK